ncbi:EGFR adapter protein-like [Wyeomyia smithii]|uniref:EGFR adapter protein-like n=1 Tax=Wyeomyia smithii TaxID=174621 RepID=UPI0024680FD6|nr:EGFR adapter protein-like [Wyeomyia smithii]XP_055542164.1 EGFR adapter protein-like [Wyeomyia smithii]XP_055542165.1 EGFR adapter protein-like [Wyeomyia smithii]XP_055542166.1 EGFR adapter protein-like [Wyeomyia smithii]
MQEVDYFNDTLSETTGGGGGGGGIGRGDPDERGGKRGTEGKPTNRNHSRKCSYDLLDHRRFNKCDENVNYTADPLLVLSSPSSSDEDNSPTELNNCIKFVEKPTLIKRFAMGFLRSNEESLPLMYHKSSPTSPQKQLNGILAEDIYSLDQIVSSKFGDSCKQSFTTDASYHHSQHQRQHQQQQQQSNLAPASPLMPRHGPDVEYEFRRKLLIRKTNSANSSPKRFVPNIKRTDSLNSIEDNDLDSASWFQAGLPREISLEVLTQRAPGAFLVRRSTTKQGCFALSLRVPPPGPKVVHYLILKTERGYKIKGFTKEFSSLRALITHHSVMPEMLPVPLSLPRPQNIPIKCKHVDDYDSYSQLHEFSKLFSDLDL